MKRALATFGTGLAALAALLMFASPARATTKWFVLRNGADCAGSESPLQAELALACAATRTCEQVTKLEDAELVARLQCSEASWVLETRTIEGRSIARVALEGSVDDRVRQAAVEIARDEAPERSLASDNLQHVLDADRPKAVLTTDQTRFAIAASGQMEVGGTGLLYGARGLAGLRIVDQISAGLVLSYAGGGSWITAAQTGRAGLGIFLGAPVSPTAWAGLGLEAGPSLVTTYNTESKPDGFFRTQSKVAAYGAMTVTLQAPTPVVRPFLSVTLGATTHGPRQALSLTEVVAASVGLAMQAF